MRARGRYDASLASLKAEQRAAEGDVASLHEKMLARRDEALSKSASELYKALDAYNKACTHSARLGMGPMPLRRMLAPDGRRLATRASRQTTT